MSKTLDNSMKELMLFAKGEENEVTSEEVNVEVVKSEEITTLLDTLFKDFDGDPEDFKVKVDWGNPVGSERLLTESDE